MIDFHLPSHGGGSCGWPRVWTIALAGRLFLADTAHERLATQMRECAWNRTMLNMGGAAPFQIDGSLGVTGAVVEALLQSHESVLVSFSSFTGSTLRAAYTGDQGRVPLIRLLPSLPVEWAVNGGGFVKGLRARGGFVVDLAWDSVGRLTMASLTSEAGNAAYVTLGQARVGGDGAEADEGASAPSIQADGGEPRVFIRLEGKKGTVFNVTLATEQR